MKSGIRVNRSRSYVDLQESASRVRDIILGPNNRDRINGIALFEGLDDFNVKGLSIKHAVRPLPSSVEAVTEYDPERKWIVVALSERTYWGLEARNARDLFTLAHEIGHVALHTRELAQLHQMPHLQRALARARDDYPIYRDSEWQANAFASALLMPADRLLALERKHGELQPELVAQNFGVSVPAAEVRLNVYRQRRQYLVRAARYEGSS